MWAVFTICYEILIMKPLFVDLDGTLLLSDSVQEVFWRLLLQHPWLACIALWQLITQGKAAFKHFMAQHVTLHTAQWPLNHAVLDYLKKEKATGRPIILLTASHESIAKKIVAPLNIFDQIVGSTETLNFKGPQKLAWIQKHFPQQQFDYAGNGPDDYILWQQCDTAIVVNPSTTVRKHAKKLNTNIQLIKNLPAHHTLWRRSLRLHQYSKNLLIFIPLLLSGQLTTHHLFLNDLLAFCAFSCVASAGYLLNDLFDLDHDRAHRHKKLRPLAAGHINFSTGCFTILALLLLTTILSVPLGLVFSSTLIIYFTTSLAYSCFFKKIAVLDVFVLSTLYLLRIVAGSAATMIAISPWLFAFALFFFLSLAYLKRFIEIEKLDTSDTIAGRAYTKKDLLLVKISGISLGFLSVLIFSLYLSSKATIAIYQYPNGLWLIALILLYWINHLWYAASHHKIHDDPIHYALLNPISLFLATATFIIILTCQGIL